MKKVFAAMLLLATATLFGCEHREPSSEIATGIFIDAPVQGLAYESGGQMGVTDGDGKFIYEIGKEVKFTIGGIILGEAPAKPVMTPLDLSATVNAESTTPDVVARVQLLMSLSSTDPADGVITIPAETHDAAKYMTINFATDNIAAKISELPKPWRKDVVVSEEEAKIHLVEALDELLLPSSAANNQGDHCNQSKDCSGSLVCRDTGSGGGRRCVGRGEKGDYCAKEDAGHGSKSCGGDLKCRDTGGGNWRCVGGGEQGDFCAESDAGHGSASCVGNLICRDTGHDNWRCVGRGAQNDFCAMTDAGHGSASCGGDLKCRDTGDSNWHCIGRGLEGDLCSEEESGRGSWSCGGTLVCAHSASSSNYICKVGSRNWMSKIADKTPVSQLTIPGTHDSATYNYSGVLSPYVVTQDLDLKTQLNYGVRFLDIRARVIKNVLAIHHSSFFLNMFLGDVLNACREFLNNNPSETIFMSVKKDHDDEDSTLSFEEAFLNRYYNSSEYKDLWYHTTIGQKFPTMGEVRGKIVLMSRSGLDSSLGIDFHIGDNETGKLNVNQYLTLNYEDLYAPGSKDKVEAVSSHLKAAQSELKTKNHALWVTFTSANEPPYYPPLYYAETVPRGNGMDVWEEGLEINRKLMMGMNLQSSNSPMGIVPMDFPDWKLIRFLVDTNFKY